MEISLESKVLNVACQLTVLFSFAKTTSISHVMKIDIKMARDFLSFLISYSTDFCWVNFWAKNWRFWRSKMNDLEKSGRNKSFFRFIRLQKSLFYRNRTKTRDLEAPILAIFLTFCTVCRFWWTKWTNNFNLIRPIELFLSYRSHDEQIRPKFYFFSKLSVWRDCHVMLPMH